MTRSRFLFAAFAAICALLTVHASAAQRPGRFFIPDTISVPAQRILREFNGVRFGDDFPASQNLGAWRRVQALYTHSAALRVRQAIEEYGVSVTAMRLNGVPVLDVRPRHWRPSRRLIVYAHGGAFVVLSAAADISEAAALSAVSGEQVVSIDYTLAPEARWNVIQRQALSVFAALRANGYRMRDIAMVGDSAGGGLTVSTVLSLRDRGLGMPAAAVLFSPWIDLTDRGDTMTTLAAADPMLGYRGLAIAARAYAGTLPLNDPRVSPLYGDFSKGFCPTLIQEGTKTIFLSASVRLYRALDLAGAHPVLDVYEGMWHDFQYVSWLPESRIAYAKAAAFIRAHQR
jgi:monoterpene epsilon-lactone hydrolase